MKIVLDNVAKKFTREWIFRGISHSFESASSSAVLGPNGSGKSTLMQLIAAYLSPGKGKLEYSINNSIVNRDELPALLSYTAPYVELIEELTLAESISFHFRFKKLKHGFREDELIPLAYLEANEDKQIRYFSSGMKQRLKLLLAVMSDTPLLLLDEPCTNLDTRGIDWYQSLMAAHTIEQTVIIASNQSYEYDFCKEVLDMNSFK